jgi:cell fate regulator YaaT (PSP1 superfamily)
MAMTSLIVGIRFSEGGKTYHFDASACPDLQVEDFVIVETSRGKQLGRIALISSPEELPGDHNWKPILRKATPRDLVLRQVWEEKEAQALTHCQELAEGYGLEEVKFVSAEYSLEGQNLIFLYAYEGKGEPALGGLLNDLRKEHADTNVELHRIGPRDAAKIIGGMGACGKEIRCCTEFMTDFSPISIKMAKAQGVSLAPSEITGMCGRLRCCLMHEHDLYVEAKKLLPNRGRQVRTPKGNGKVVRLDPLSRKVVVDLGESGLHEFDHREVETS